MNGCFPSKTPTSLPGRSVSARYAAMIRCKWCPVASTGQPFTSKPRLVRALSDNSTPSSPGLTASRNQAGLDPLLRAGIAHFWFVTLHPFDDGNGRLTRTITDLALAQGEAQAIRFYAMSASILEDRSGYYRVLETCQKATLDITEWLEWFLQTLLRSLQQAMARIESVLGKARFWQAHRMSALSAEQIKVLNRLLDGGERGFEDGHQRGSVPGCGEGFESHRDPSSGRTAGERLPETPARWWAQYSVPDQLSR